MGNYISSKLRKNSRKSTKVILPTGEIRHIHQTTAKAAELMMEAPNYFIANTKCLKIGKRFHPLSADDDLEKGHVYVMFPMHRKNSLVTAGDMVVLFITAKKVVKRGSIRNNNNNNNNIKVLPESQALPRLSFEGVEDVSTNQFRHRMSMSRSKKPLLETIEEESICSR